MGDSFGLLQRRRHASIHPLVKTVDQITPETDRGVGAVCQCNMYNGNTVVECIKEWDEAGKTYVVKLVDGSLPLKSLVIKLAAMNDGDGRFGLWCDMHAKAKMDCRIRPWNAGLSCASLVVPLATCLRV